MSKAQHMEPDYQDWLNDQRKNYLLTNVKPLASLLSDAGLLDKTLKFWIDQEIISESCSHCSDLPSDFSSSDDIKSDSSDQDHIISWSSLQWGRKIETLYLNNKNRLDQVVCRLITVESSDLAYEIYFRLMSEEDTFENLVIRFSVGQEKFQGGLFPRQSLDSFPKGLHSQLRSMEPGSLLKPFKYGKGFAVLELKEWYHATLDASSEHQLLKWEYQSWKTYMLPYLKKLLCIPST